MIELLASNTATPIEGDRLFVDLLPWLGLILLLVAILIVTIYIGRRMVRGDDDVSDQPFTLQSLRELHASGQLSDEEFQRARDAMIGRIRTTADESPAEASPGSDDDPSDASEGGERSHAGDRPQDHHDQTQYHTEQDPSTDDADMRPGQADNGNEDKPRGDST